MANTPKMQNNLTVDQALALITGDSDQSQEGQLSRALCGIIVDAANISVEAASTLLTYKGRIQLRRLENFSVAVATILAKHDHDLTLDLSNADIEEGAIQALAQHEHDLTLRIPGNISIGDAESLGSQRRLSDLDIYGDISLSVAEALFKGSQIRHLTYHHLDDEYEILELSTETAKSLGLYKGRLTFATTTKSALKILIHEATSSRPPCILTRETIVSICKNKKELNLRLSPTFLTAQAAEGLKNFKGALKLDLPALCAETASNVLSTTRLKTYLRLTGEIGLRRGESEKFAKVIADSSQDVWIDQDEPLSEQTTAALSKHKGRLHIMNPQFATIEAAKILATKKGELDLTFNTLSPPIAKELCSRDSSLELSVSGPISAKSARELSQYKDTLILNTTFTPLSEEAASELKNIKSHLILMILLSDKITPEAVREISQTKAHLGLQILSGRVTPTFIKHVGEHRNQLCLYIDTFQISGAEELLIQHFNLLEVIYNVNCEMLHQTAEKLIQLDGMLIITQSMPLNHTVAETLAQRTGRLSLSAPLNVKSATALLAYSGERLNIYGSSDFTPEVLEILSNGNEAIHLL